MQSGSIWAEGPLKDWLLERKKMRKAEKRYDLMTMLGGVILLTIVTISTHLANVQYEWEAGAYWTLADKASTLEEKSAQIDNFVSAVDKQELQGMHNATLLFTPDNSFHNNRKALGTLQTRLQEIKTLDPNSFAYQTAIQQITAQEQGEAAEMLGNLYGCWMLKNHPMLWSWHGGALVVVSILAILGGLFAWLSRPIRI